MRRRAEPLEIACQQVMAEDSSVCSVQWTVIPAQYAASLTSGFLMERYLCYIRRATLSLVRPTRTAEGMEFRLLRSSVSILTFTEPAVTADEHADSVSLSITGGVLVQREQCGRGEMSLSCERHDNGIKVTLFLSDYCPLLLGGYRASLVRKWLYRLTQAYIHKKVTTTFLGRIYRELAGNDVCVRVVKGKKLAGEEI